MNWIRRYAGRGMVLAATLLLAAGREAGAEADVSETNAPPYDREALLRKYSTPPQPVQETEGMPGLLDDHQVDELNDEAAEQALEDFLDPQAKKEREEAEFRKHLGTYLFLNFKAEKDKPDLRMKGLTLIEEFIDDPFLQDEIFTRGVIPYFDINPDYIPRCIAVYMTAGPHVVPRLIKLLREGKTWMVRTRMASVLYQAGGLKYDKKGVMDALMDVFLNDPSEDVRGPLFRMFVGEWGNLNVNDEFESVLPGLLRNEDNTLIKYCLTWYRYVARTQAGTHNYIPLFRDVLKSGKGWENRWFALRGLWGLRYTKTQDKYPVLETEVPVEIADSLRNDPNWRVRFLALECLLDFDHAVVMEAFCDALAKDPDEDIRSYAAVVIGYREDVKGVPALISALKDESPLVRYKAAEALGRLGDPRAVKPLEEFGSDPEWWVEKAVQDALVALSGSQAAR